MAEIEKPLERIGNRLEAQIAKTFLILEKELKAHITKVLQEQLSQK